MLVKLTHREWVRRIVAGRMAKVSAEKRQEIARNAAKARWAKKRKAVNE